MNISDSTYMKSVFNAQANPNNPTPGIANTGQILIAMSQLTGIQGWKLQEQLNATGKIQQRLHSLTSKGALNEGLVGHRYVWSIIPNRFVQFSQ